MTITKNTIIAEILNNDPPQGCVPIFLSTGMHCLAAWLPMARPLRLAPSTCVDRHALVAELNDYFAHLYALRLDARLAAAFAYIRPGHVAADIGCDHGKFGAPHWRAAVAARLFWLVTFAPAAGESPV